MLAASPIVCGAPSPPVNGHIVGNVLNVSEVGTMIQYRCNDGLSPVGNLLSQCSSGGMWSPNPAEIKCAAEPRM